MGRMNREVSLERYEDMSLLESVTANVKSASLIVTTGFETAINEMNRFDEKRNLAFDAEVQITLVNSELSLAKLYRKLAENGYTPEQIEALKQSSKQKIAEATATVEAGSLRL